MYVTYFHFHDPEFSSMLHQVVFLNQYQVFILQLQAFFKPNHAYLKSTSSLGHEHIQVPFYLFHVFQLVPSFHFQDFQFSFVFPLIIVLAGNSPRESDHS